MRRLLSGCLAVALAALVLSPLSVLAAPPEITPIPAHCLRDGRRQNLWLLPHCLAVFTQVRHAAEPPFTLDDIRKALPGAELRQFDSGLVLAHNDAWRTVRDVNRVADSLLTRHGMHAFGTFSLSAQDLEPRWILTGRIVVKFRQGHDRATDKRWLRTAGLMEPRSLGGGTWVFKGGVGVRTLQTANSLEENLDVESASPDWLHPMDKKRDTHPK